MTISVKLAFPFLISVASLPGYADMFELEFSNPSHFTQIYLVHDTVMGGRSNGDISQNGDAVQFAGNLSLANNGGFASVDFALRPSLAEATFDRLALTVNGDNRTYQLRLKTPLTPSGVAYVAEFSTSNALHTHYFNLADFNGRYRGRRVINLPELRFNDVTHISIMLADKTAGTFNIGLYNVKFYKE